jgi:prepilin-type N-terminal cleavage/methylation domain-containing protein
MDMLVRGNAALTARRGFSLVELLVVLLIFGILMAIAVPSLISSQPQRNLAAAGDRFAQDYNYCRAKSNATGNRVFLAFETTPDVKQVEGYFNSSLSPTDVNLAPTTNGPSYIPPGNPGVSRTATAYDIVEERPRYKKDTRGVTLSSQASDNRGEKYTYLDWLNDYDAWSAGNGNYPVEPMYPYSVVDTTALGSGLDPKTGPFNAVSAPLLVYPGDISTLSGVTDYVGRHISTVRSGGVIWSDGDANDQQFKIFCVQDQASILAMDDGAKDALTNLRTYDPAADNPQLQDQVMDYVLLKRVTLPDHCVFINPWKDNWVVSWTDTNNDGNPDEYNHQDMQFLQYLWVFEPGQGHDFGGVKLGFWTYDPEAGVGGVYGGQTHGTIRVSDSLVATRHMWMTLDECIDSGTALAYPAAPGDPSGFGAVTSVLGGTNTGNEKANKKVNQSSSGREFTFWSLGFKYYVDEYTPNDSANEINPDDPRLNDNYVIPAGSAGSTMDSVLVSREIGYNRNFLVPGTLP